MAALTLSRKQIQAEILGYVLRTAYQIVAAQEPQHFSQPITLVDSYARIFVAKDWLGEVAFNAGEVRRFCDHHSIMTATVAVCQMAERSFPSSKISLVVEQDNESDASWLVVDVESQLPTSDLLTSYDSFIRKWATYPNTRARGLINLTFCQAPKSWTPVAS